MKRIVIDIDILNHLDIVKKRKGRFPAWIAKYLLREETVKKEIEKRVMDEIHKNIEMNLQVRLPQEGIEARLNIRQVDIDRDADKMSERDTKKAIL